MFEKWKLSIDNKGFAEEVLTDLKLVSAIFYQIFIFQEMVALQKLLKCFV